MTIFVSTDLYVDYFNNHLEVWEPVIEPWNVIFKVFFEFLLFILLGFSLF